MRVDERCLPCLVNQVVKTARMTGVENRERLYARMFEYMSRLDYSLSNPEIIGDTFSLIKTELGNSDPYCAVRRMWNERFLQMENDFAREIDGADDPFRAAAVHAIIGNLIDANPVHEINTDAIMAKFAGWNELALAVDDIDKLRDDVTAAKHIMYIGDNCGEICLDKLFLREIRNANKNAEINFVTRGAPVVNDSIEEDAYFVGMDKYAKILPNGDYSLGTVLSRASAEFNAAYEKADVVICKGSGNYESLGEEKKNIYFMLMVKCAVMADCHGLPIGSIVCKRAL